MRLLERRPAASCALDPRETLRTAQAAAAVAQAAALTAVALVERALAAVDAAGASLRAFEGLDGRIGQWHADRLRSGLPGDRTPLPSHLAAGRKAKADAEQNLLDAEAAAVLLASESLAAATAAGAADAAVRAAVIPILREHAQQALRGMREAEADAANRRIVVSAYSYVWSDSAKLAAVPSEVGLVGYDPVHSPLSALASLPWMDAAAAWAAFRTALEISADAASPACLRP